MGNKERLQKVVGEGVFCEAIFTYFLRKKRGWWDQSGKAPFICFGKVVAA